MGVVPHLSARRVRGVIVPAVMVLVAGLTAVATTNPAAATTEQTYIILYKQGVSSADAGQLVSAAGGTLVANWSEIGVVVARSSSADFGQVVGGNSKVEGAASTAGLGVRADMDDADAGPLPGSVPAPNSESDTLTGLQWDMWQINAFAAHDISGGSPEVLVADVDTGLDFTHPDLAPNYSAENSTDCSSGVPQPLLPGNDANGHGTHTAGTIAAAANGSGIVGVAPNVKIAGIKSANDSGFFFPEMVICSYMWVASHGIDITNNSYFADPWLFNCKNDPVQRVIWNAERRAIRHAQSKGTLVVSSEGNRRSDLSHPQIDTISPDFPPGSAIVREITNACAVVPVEVPGVIGVTATGNRQLKSSYSDYGISTADVAAPGGDAALQVTPAAPNGRVLSTWPLANPCLRTVFDPGTGAKYCYIQGTSMASPHAVGVAALIMSQTGATGGALAAYLQQATNPRPCPDPAIYAPFPQTSGEPQACTGGTMHNSFYGSGEVDALKAVS